MGFYIDLGLSSYPEYFRLSWHMNKQEMEMKIA